MNFNWVSELQKIQENGRRAVLVTVTACTGSGPRDPGAKMLVFSQEEFLGTIGGGHLESLAILDALKVLAEGQAKTIRYPLGAKTGQCCGGTMDLFFEPINQGPSLYLFGAGHVAQALCRTLMGTPFTVHVIDDRESWVQSPAMPAGVIRHESEWDEFVSKAVWDKERTYVAVMTYRHDTDQAIIEKVTDLPARYIGLIGSESKWARFKQRMSLKTQINEDQIARVRCPIGLPTGGKAPQEVAISIAAELLQCFYGSAQRAK